MFWPPAIVLAPALGASLVDFRDFLAAATTANRWILDHLGWLISLSSFAAVLVMAAIFVSPLGGVRIGGAAIRLDSANGGALTAALDAEGPEAVMYALLGELPLTGVFASVFVFTTFISFVTAMDSNTHSIASVCLKARRQEDEVRNAGLWVKIFWGVLIGAVAFVMTATTGVDGIRMLSNLGGVPGLIILLGCGAVLIRLATTSPARLNAAR